MPSAVPWYDSAVAVSAAGVLVTLAVTIWVALYVARPRQALYYHLRSAAPVTEYSNDELRAASVRHGMADPQVLDIWLRGRGRRDISSAAFDAGKPIAIKTPNGRIVKLLDKSTSQPSRSVPDAWVSDGSLMVGPGLIGRSQLLKYKVLADVKGLTPQLDIQGSLIDVRIGPRFERFLGLLAAVVFTFLVVAFFAVNNGLMWHLTGPLATVRYTTGPPHRFTLLTFELDVAIVTLVIAGLWPLVTEALFE